MTANVKDEALKKVKMLIRAFQSGERIFQLPTTKKGDFPIAVNLRNLDVPNDILGRSGFFF